jgi:hypothetical protein
LVKLSLRAARTAGKNKQRALPMLIKPIYGRAPGAQESIVILVLVQVCDHAADHAVVADSKLAPPGFAIQLRRGELYSVVYDRDALFGNAQRLDKEPRSAA